MSFAPGVRLGGYEIQSALGVGGMGEVYRARDTKLHRDVALKILPEAFAGDPDRLARFEREAQVLASLNHPNIAAIYGLEDANDVRALVLELVEGPTLADRIATGRVPGEEALSIARQIAEALGAAHEHGIVHRDLKPANIKVRPDGTVKVLDFGLAKVLDHDGGGSGLSQSPTVTGPAVTRAGGILGTAAYMAPEQAMGRDADARSDIWAFGLVLYEMLTGRRGFAGETIVEVLSNVLKTEPEWAALPAATPPAVRSLVRRCLQKDPTRRLRDIADARFQIEEVLSEPAGGAAIGTPAPVRKARERLLWAAGLLVTLVAGLAAGARYFRTPQIQTDEIRLEINAPPTTDPASFAISPDGKTLVFVATSDGHSRLWLRPLSGVSARPLGGTENAKYPFWSPDNRSVGFSANGQLKRVDVGSGSVQIVASGGALGGAWNRDGTILFDRGLGGSLFRVSADGGETSSVTQNTAEAHDHWFPQFLPDHRHFLFYATGTKAGIYLGQLDSSEAPQWLLDAQAATYESSGHLFFVRERTLFAQAFDLVRRELAGSPMPIAEQLVISEQAAVGLSVSAAGPVVYRTGSSSSHFVWFDRSGMALETLNGSDIGTGFNSSLSPDGRRLALSRRTNTSDIWVLDIGRGVPSRFTFDPMFDVIPVWSPDGRRVAFASNREGTFDLYVRASDGSGKDDPLGRADDVARAPSDWSPDGRFILYGRADRDIWAYPMDGVQKAFPVVDTPFIEVNGQFSPDGKWIAYQSDRSGRAEIYVQPFPGPGRETLISSEGGIQVRWRHDGQELFYLGRDNQLMAVRIGLDLKSETVDVGTPEVLFVPHVSGVVRQAGSRHYMVSRDGQRFLVDTPKEVTLPITVVLNWKP